MNEGKKRIIAAAAAFVLGVGVTAGGVYGWMKATGTMLADEKTYEDYRETAKRYAKLAEIEELIESDYLWDADENDLMEAACDALLAALGDPYSRYLSEEEIAGMESRLSGDMVGVGIRIYENEDGAPAVSDVISESPADASGIEAGDIIRKIDGKKVSTTEEVSSALYGEAGTTVSVTYERDGEETTVSLVRGEIRDSSVNSVMLEDNVGYIRIKTFGEKTADDFASELSAMEKRQVQGVIIDLRGNSGGLMEQGIATADALLPAILVLAAIFFVGSTLIALVYKATAEKYVIDPLANLVGKGIENLVMRAVTRIRAAAARGNTSSKDVETDIRETLCSEPAAFTGSDATEEGQTDSTPESKNEQKPVSPSDLHPADTDNDND